MPHRMSGFEAIEEDGSVHSVPYHRVRAVWRDGELIWSRNASRGSAVLPAAKAAFGP